MAIRSEVTAASDLDGVQVCVTSINYAPEPTGSAPYTAGLAEILAAHGASVEVITGVPHYPSWQIAPEYRWRLRATETRNGVRVRRARHFVPAHQSAVTRMLWDGTFLANASAVRLSRRPDLVIASTPSLSGAIVGARRARRHHVPFGVVVQDLLGQAARQSGITGGKLVASAVDKVESSVLRSADQVAIASPTFRRQLEAYGVVPDRIQVLPNWTHIAPATRDRGAVRRQLGWDDDVFVVLHTGNMGLKQDLGNAVEAARLLSDAGGRGGAGQVLVVLMGDGNQRAALAELGHGVSALRIEPPVDADMYPDVLRAADLLLVNELPAVGEMSLPSKLTSYFASGNAILAAVSPDGACAHEVGASEGAAVRIDPGDPALLAEEIRTLQLSPVVRAEMGRAAASYAERALGRDLAARKIVEWAKELLSATSVSNRRTG